MIKIKKLKKYSKAKEVLKISLKKLGEKIVSVCIAGGCVLVVFSLAEAVDDSSNPITDSPLVSDTTTDGTTETSLTSQEVDKIISDLKASGNIDNILAKLDEIAKRAELVGNAALKDYALQMKDVYELQKQLESSKSMVSAMKKKNTEINEVDKQVSKILSVTTIVEDLRGAVSDETLVILESLTQDQLKDLQELIAEIESVFDLNDIFSMSIRHRALLDIMVLNEVINQNMLESEERLTIAKDALSVAITILKSYEKQRYIPSEYISMAESSDKFAVSGKKTKSVSPEQVVFFDGAFSMKKTPIMYDGHILVSIDDLFQYIDAKIEYMYDSANMVIQSSDKILEISAGKNTAYLNDIPKSMPVPILNFNKTIYMSVESFSEFYDISYRFIPEHEFVVLFHNLTQLTNTSVPNQLNK